MNWKPIIDDLQSSGMTLEGIATQVGLSSRSSVHYLQTKPGADTTSAVGEKLKALHKKVMRRQARWPSRKINFKTLRGRDMVVGEHQVKYLSDFFGRDVSDDLVSMSAVTIPVKTFNELMRVLRCNLAQFGVAKPVEEA